MIHALPIRLDYYQQNIETWQTILQSFDFSSVSTIIDLCPGWAPKIELALLHTNFIGTLLAVDQSKDHLSFLKHLLDPFPKRYTMQYRNLHIFENHPRLQTDMLIGNHIIDDLLIEYYQKKNKQKPNPFVNMKTLPIMWNDILADKEISATIFNNFIPFLDASINRNGFLLISHYPSYQEKLYGLQKSTKACMHFFKQLENELVASNRFTQKNHLLTSLFAKMNNPYFTQKEIIYIQKSLMG